MSAPVPPASACAGTGLVLLHGWAMTPSVWAPLRPMLGGRHCIAPPLPGHAGAPAASGADIASWADRLAAALPPAATVVGWSLGALLALALAHRHPAHVARLVLIGGTARFVAAAGAAGAAPWPGLEPATVAAFRAGFANDPRATLKRFVALQCLGEADRRGIQTRLGAALTPLAGDGADTGAAATRHDHALADGLAVLADTDLRPLLARIEQPCLLIHGEHDALMPLAAARATVRMLPRARLEVLPASGHALPLSRSGDCARLVAAFADA